MKQDVMPASILSGVIDMAVSLQISIESLLKQAGIDPALVGADNAYLTAEQLGALLSALKSASGDRAFGLHYGQNNHYHGRSVVVELLYSRACGTVPRRALPPHGCSRRSRAGMQSSRR